MEVGGHTGIFVLGDEHLLDLVTNISLGELDIVLGVTIVRHEGKEAVIGNIKLVLSSDKPLPDTQRGKGTHQLIFLTVDVGNVHVVGGGGEILQLLAGEDVDGDQVDLGVTVLSSLGGRHVDNLARAVLDDDVTVLPQSGTLHGEGGRSASIGAVEANFML